MTQEVNLGYFRYVIRLKNQIGLYKIASNILLVPRILLFPLILLYSVLLWVVLGLRRKLARGNARAAVPSHPSDSMLKAMSMFVDQYPFHYYPILSKGYELFYLKDIIARRRILENDLLEFAVGEASLSSKVFDGAKKAMIGCDLNPYSLYQCRRYDHFKALIVADVTNPPVVDGTIDCILSMNFLHHITQKDDVLKKRSALADKVIFNENSPYWASTSCGASFLSMLGLKKLAAAAAKKKELVSHQSLLAEDQIDRIVSEHYEVTEKITFIDRSTMLLSNISSCLMLGVYGPPTPPVIRMLSKPFLPLARAAARELFLWDHLQDRKHDVFLLYLGKSRNFKKIGGGPLFFDPEQREPFALGQTDRPSRLSRDGMVFLLPKNQHQVFDAYDSATQSAVPAQHL